MSSFWVDICDSAFSPWTVLLLPRPSRDHGSGRHGDGKGRMEMLPAALCVSGFTLRVPPLVHFLSPPPLPQPSTQEQVRAVSVEGNDLRRGEGVSCATQHTCHLLSTHQSLWLEETRSMVTARAFAWTHFPCLSFSLAVAQFSVYLHPVCFWLSPHSLSSSSASSRLSCFMGSSRHCLSTSVFFPLLWCKGPGWGVVGWTALGMETAHPTADLGLGAGEALVPE